MSLSEKAVEIPLKSEGEDVRKASGRLTDGAAPLLVGPLDERPLRPPHGTRSVTVARLRLTEEARGNDDTARGDDEERR